MITFGAPFPRLYMRTVRVKIPVCIGHKERIVIRRRFSEPVQMIGLTLKAPFGAFGIVDVTGIMVSGFNLLICPVDAMSLNGEWPIRFVIPKGAAIELACEYSGGVPCGVGYVHSTDRVGYLRIFVEVASTVQRVRSSAA